MSTWYTVKLPFRNDLYYLKSKVLCELTQNVSLIFKNKLTDHELKHYKLCSCILKTVKVQVLRSGILSSILQELNIIKFK